MCFMVATAVGDITTRVNNAGPMSSLLLLDVYGTNGEAQTNQESSYLDVYGLSRYNNKWQK